MRSVTVTSVHARQWESSGNDCSGLRTAGCVQVTNTDYRSTVTELNCQQKYCTQYDTVQHLYLNLFIVKLC